VDVVGLPTSETEKEAEKKKKQAEQKEAQDTNKKKQDEKDCKNENEKSLPYTKALCTASNEAQRRAVTGEGLQEALPLTSPESDDSDDERVLACRQM